MDIWSLLEGARSRSPGGTAIVDGGRRFSYGDLHRRASALARCLASRGVARGDRVAIHAWNGAEYLEAYFAAAGLGAVLVPINARLAAPEVDEILRLSDARVRISSRDFRRESGEVLCLGEAYETALERHAGDLVREEVGPDALAHLYFTSGTTGRPKGVALTHRNVCAHARAVIQELALSSRDVWGHIAPMFHLADAWATFAITEVGGVHALLPKFEAEAALAMMARERVTITNLVPTMLARMVAHLRDRPAGKPEEFSNLRLVLSGGAPIAPALVAEVIAALRCDYAQTYGMTETSPFLTISLLRDSMRSLPPEEQLRIRCKTGRPFRSVELRVVGEDGLDVPRDERTVGEIFARGETVTPGYWNDPEATRAAFVDGWLRTGDLAVIDGEGYLTIVDRRKDVIKTGGETVYTTEVENALQEHPSVLETAVVGMPDSDLGERIVAAVVLRPGAESSAEDIATACRARLAGFKIPREIRFLAELPRTGSGKVSKRELRELFRA